MTILQTFNPLRRTLAAGALALLTACAGGGGVATRYYVIGPVDAAPLAEGGDALSVQIMGLELPQYLERVQIASQAGPDRLRFSEAHQWGENLRKNLMRTLARNLSRLLASPDIGTPTGRSARTPDYSVRVTIEQFERDLAGVVQLDATWQVADATGASPPRSFQTRLQSPRAIPSGDYDAMVAAMRSLFGELSAQIAQQLLAMEQQ